MKSLIRYDLKSSFKKKSTIFLFTFIIGLCVLWVFGIYYQGIKMLESNMDYQSTTLPILETKNIFNNYIRQMTTTISVFPFIFYGALVIYEDVKNKCITQYFVLSKSKYKYLFVKVANILIFNLLMLLLIFVTSILLSISLPNVKVSSLSEIMDAYNFAGLLLVWLGLNLLSLMSLSFTLVFKSALAAGAVAVYILLERIFTNATAIAFQNPVLMKINEYLPWSNLNSLFIYATDLKNLTSGLSMNQLMEEAGVLTMFRMTSYKGVEVAYPFFKSLYSVTGTCLIYTIIFFIILIKSYNKFSERS